MPPNPELKKTILLGVGAALALGLLLFVMQASQQKRFWKELNDYRATDRFAEFLEWERKQRDGDDS
jgi:hypothetical protein